MCNGHSEICDQEGGQNCQCKNNTETKCSAEVKLKMACHEVQVSIALKGFETYLVLGQRHLRARGAWWPSGRLLCRGASVGLR